MSILLPPLSHGIRGTDKYGAGHYGAPRDGGTRKHAGVDLICEPGEVVLMPFDGVMTMHGIAYADDPRFRTVRVFSHDEPALQVRLLYVQPEVPIGRTVHRGDVIAAAQNIALKYLDITIHVHMELRRDGLPIDPTPYLFDA